jgi:hypothetical protein
MHHSLRSSRYIAWFAIVAAATGCGGGDGVARVLVSGAVTFDGKPVEKGQIRFIPAAGTTGPITIDAINAGRYTTESTGGVPLGTHRVEITGYDAAEYANAPTGPGSPPVRQRLPEKYNRKSELTVTLQPEAGDQPLDFNLTP